MKKLLLTVICFLSFSIVHAAEYSLDHLVQTINGGQVTKAFEKQMEKEGCKGNYAATSSGSQLIITYNYQCEAEKEEYINNKVEKVKYIAYDVSDSIYYTLEGNILVSTINRTPKQDETDPYYVKILQLTPYWGAEMSNKSSEISKYMKKNHRNELLQAYAAIFDRCFMEEMGVCYSRIPNLNDVTYVGKITMDDSGATFALKYLKQEQRDLNNKSLVRKLAVFAIILVVIILILKSMIPDPRRKRCKY